MQRDANDFVIGDSVTLRRAILVGGDAYAVGTKHEITAVDEARYPYLLDGEYRVPADQIELAFESRYGSERLEKRLGTMCGLETLGHLLGVMITQREVDIDPEELVAWAAENCDAIWDNIVAPALDKIEDLHALHVANGERSASV